jgi:hypothetical protein
VYPFIRTSELAASFLLLAALAVAALFGWTLRSVLAVGVLAALLLGAEWRLRLSQVGLWRGLRHVAARNTTGVALLSLLISLPLLTATSLIGIALAAGSAFAPTRSFALWIAFLRVAGPTPHRQTREPTTDWDAAR